MRYFKGMETPVKRPDLVDMVIFRENTEDIYAGIEFREGTPEVAEFKQDLRGGVSRSSSRRFGFPTTSGIGIKPISREGSERLIRAAIEYAVANKRKSLTLVHKGNIMKFTEGAFRDWGYELAKREFGAVEFDGGPWCKLPGGLVIKDVIADAFLQQILTRPAEYDVIATPNLNGDYISDALAAQVGGIGIAPGGNINYVTGHAVFEATHGTAPKYAEPGQGQSGLGHPVRRDDAALPGLDRGGRPRDRVAREDDRVQAGHLRPGAPDRRARPSSRRRSSRPR